MRNFSDFEKKIIRQIVEFGNPNIADSINYRDRNIASFIANTILVNRGIYIERQKKEISLLFATTDTTALYDFFDMISLIDYLEKERLIFVHTNPNPFPGNFLSHNWQKNDLIDEFIDSNGNVIPPGETIKISTNVYDIFLRYINSFYHPVSELKALVEDNFETIEIKQLKESLKQTKYSKLAFYIALFALLFTICYSAFFTSNVQLDKRQYDSLIKVINVSRNQDILRDSIFKNNLDIKLDTLKSYVKKNQTIK